MCADNSVHIKPLRVHIVSIGNIRARLIRAGHDGAAVNETVTVTGVAEENETGATKSEYALEHAQHPSLSAH